MISDDHLKPLPEDIDGLIAGLKQHISLGEKNIKDFQKRYYNGIQENAVIYCLEHGVDIGKGCLTTSIAKLPDSLTTLSRALVEAFIWSRYVTLSKENAQEFSDGTIQEMARIARKNIKSGYARIVKTSTHEDASENFLNLPQMKSIPQRLRIEDAARASGLERLYTQIYGFISLYAHGKGFGINKESDVTRRLYTSLSTALGTLECINLIASDWIVYRKQTPMEMLNMLIGL